MKKAISLILIPALLICLFSLAGCGEYSSKYKALGCVNSNTVHSSVLTFSEFEGRKVMKVRCSSETGGQMYYSATLESGSAKVYYDIDGTKLELFSVKAGENVNSALTDLGKCKIYIIIETDGKCTGGEFRFETA